MSEKSAAIGFITLFSILCLGVGLMNHVTVLPPLLEAAGRDAWVSVIFTIFPYSIWTAAVYYIMKKTKQEPFLEWLKKRYGAAVSFAVRALFFMYLFLMCTLTLKETAMWTHSSYLPRTPQFVLAGTLVFVCGYAVYYGIKTIAIASGILLPFVVIFGDFVMSSNFRFKDYSLLTPLFEHGFQPVLEGSMYVGGGLAELSILLLLQHHLKKQVKYWHLMLLALFLVFLVFGPTTGAIAEFGPVEASNLRYPAYEEWRLVKIGKYIQHVDFLSIHQWMSGAFARISISLYLMTELLPTGHNNKRRMIWIVGLGTVIVVAVGKVPFSDMQYLSFLKDFYLPVSLWAVTGLLFVLFALVLFSKKEHKGETNVGNQGNDNGK